MTIQAKILQLIRELQDELNISLVMVTHDLGVIAETVDRVEVMYGGRLMEQGAVQEIFDAPAHPYTQALLNSMPGRTAGRQRLIEIDGTSPNPMHPPSGCPFHPRCTRADARCVVEVPEFVKVAPGREAACLKL